MDEHDVARAESPRRLRLPELLVELGAAEHEPTDKVARAGESLAVGHIVDKAQEAGFHWLF